MENKKIIGLIGKPKLVKIVSSNLEKHGFHKISVVDKIREIASFLLPKDEIKKDIVIQKFREKAYKIHRWYWINILLSSVPSNCKNIVIDDIMEEDVVPDVMTVYRISEKNIEEVQKELFG